MAVDCLVCWTTDFGEIFLPSDFPKWALRKDGWYDKRRKISVEIQRYIQFHTDVLKEQGYGPIKGLGFEESKPVVQAAKDYALNG